MPGGFKPRVALLVQNPPMCSLRALGLMALSVVGFSLFPVFVLLTGATGFPFVFAAFWRAGFAFGFLGFLFVLPLAFR